MLRHLVEIWGNIIPGLVKTQVTYVLLYSLGGGVLLQMSTSGSCYHIIHFKTEDE